VGKCCEECLYPLQELGAHRCPLCKKHIHCMCCQEWEIPIYNDIEHLCLTCHNSRKPAAAAAVNPSRRGGRGPSTRRRSRQQNGTEGPQRRRLTQIERLDLVDEQQKRSTVMDSTVYQHMGRVKVLTRVLWKIKGLRAEAFELDPVSNKPLKHIGPAKQIYKLKFPVTTRVASLLFSQVSIDTELVNRKRKRLEESESDESDDDIIEVNDLDDLRDPSKDLQTVSAQTYQNYKSALKWWHEFEDIELCNKPSFIWPEEIDVVIKKKTKAYKRAVGLKKRRGVMRVKEGKSPYNIRGYIAICSFFNKLKPHGHQHPWMEGVFASLFTKLSVNTIGRSDNIGDIRLTDIDWENDALCLSFANTKSDIEGETTSDKKRLYANPFIPEICCILGLAIYVWVKCRVGQATWLFDGEGQNTRYYKQLKNAMAEIPVSIDIGCKREDVGTHSNRKFAESMAVSRIDGPSRTQVCLRAGQSVGRTQDCYMFAEEDGDSLVGRTVAQLKFTADEFDILPPHFSTETLQELHTHGWERILPSYQSYPESFRRVIPYLFAQLVHHYHNGNLNRILPNNHPLFDTPVFRMQRALVDSLKEKVICVHGECHDTHMTAQGVPGVIINSRENRNTQKYCEQNFQILGEKFTQMSLQMQHIVSALPQKIIDLLLEKIRIEGVQPVTLESIQSLIMSILTSENSPLQMMRSEIRTISERIGTPRDNEQHGDATRERDSTVRSQTGYTHRWQTDPEKIHMVPEGFRWPDGKNTRTMWDLWLFGNGIDKIVPYRRIEPKHELVTDDCRTRFSRTKGVMKKLISILITDSKISRLQDINESNSQSMFEYSFGKIVLQMYGEENRHGDLVIDTIYTRLRRMKLLVKGDD
jgi:hypothetical protein